MREGALCGARLEGLREPQQALGEGACLLRGERPLLQGLGAESQLESQVLLSGHGAALSAR